ncbi:hypothetical protein TIFTF001_020141 [Ficus carica]|uniref:Uncharacterized protein n=1 Tax=Ficus carica TaxID=3494 RepID=A0AA88ATP6_FICCA|nr:hypothetical protein TIFTF001_020141 [Ficus carica]
MAASIAKSRFPVAIPVAAIFSGGVSPEASSSPATTTFVAATVASP